MEEVSSPAPRPAPAPATAGAVAVRRGGSAQLTTVPDLELAAELLERLRNGRTLPARTDPLPKLLGVLATELALRCTQPANRFHPDRSRMLLHQLRQHPDFTMERLVGATCVDLGCGSLNPLGPLFVLLLHGAARGIGIDAEAVAHPAPAARALYDVATAMFAASLRPGARPSPAELVERLAGFDLPRLAAGDHTSLPERLGFRMAYAETAGLEPGSVDLLASNSFLEHVPDPRAVIAASAAACRPGALSVQLIDATDHRRYGDPDLHPLAYYREDAEGPLLRGCNRIPAVDFGPMFEAEGFEIRDRQIFKRIELSDADRAGFVAPFRDRPLEELEPLVVTYYLRRR